MTRYPGQVDREYLSCRSGGLNKIQMIDGGTLDLHQDLVACDRRRRYIVEHQLPTVFQQSDGFHASSPSATQWEPPARAPQNSEHAVRGSTMGSMKNTGRRITWDGKRRPRTVSSMRHLLSKCGTPVCLRADPT